jgi:hypothetical protein
MPQSADHVQLGWTSPRPGCRGRLAATSCNGGIAHITQVSLLQRVVGRAIRTRLRTPSGASTIVASSIAWREGSARSMPGRQAAQARNKRGPARAVTNQCPRRSTCMQFRTKELA